ncbi:hypothetical protein [Mycetohabitans rhizoxinica]|uniref:hypothetical protein n=1 Tax=Mycetohabitans rhizoxinica TaxID=412963 RepID=UPI0030D216AF
MLESNPDSGGCTAQLTVFITGAVGFLQQYKFDPTFGLLLFLEQRFFFIQPTPDIKVL